MVTGVIQTLLCGKKPSLTAGEQLWDYLYAADAARAFRLIAEQGKSGKIYPLGGGSARPLREYVEEILKKLTDLGCRNVILTGVSYEEGRTGVVVYENGEYSYYEHEKLKNSCHGTGDIYASAFVGALMRGKSAYNAAEIAAEYTLECIRATAEQDNHWYGAAFELAVPKLIELLK
jgi:pyridoxal/pyridoxine/pyridoxamine kinase